VTSLGIQRIARGCSRLETLIVANCYNAMNEESYASLDESCSTSLRHINVTNCTMTDEIASKYICHLTALTALVIGNHGGVIPCNITDGGLVAIANGCTLIESIDLSNAACMYSFSISQMTLLLKTSHPSLYYNSYN
jgi:hypothetical protein